MLIKNLNNIRKEIVESKPLIHCITNPISINQCANIILAVGAQPVMAEHPGEVREITGNADAVLLNLGNITDVRMKSMLISGKRAAEKGIPVVIDAVGIACSSLRRKYILNLMKSTVPAVIKGNYSEIKALYDEKYCTLGVDTDLSLDIESQSTICEELSGKYGCIVLATGKIDIITDGKRLIYVNNGTGQLSSVTGTGCMLGALCAAYMTRGANLDSAIASVAFFDICGELSKTEKGNGTFMKNLMDNLSTLSDDLIKQYINLEEKK